MRLTSYFARLLGLSEAIHKWQESLAQLEASRREQIAAFAESIAATLLRAATALATLDRHPADARAKRDAIRELARISGYVEDIVSALEDHLDGRKLAGVKRRLDQLSEPQPLRLAIARKDPDRIDALVEAEGYFRALADALRGSPT